MKNNDTTQSAASPAPAPRWRTRVAALAASLVMTACAVVPLDHYGEPVAVSPAEAVVSTAIITFGALHFLGALGHRRGSRHWGGHRRGHGGWARGNRRGGDWGRGGRSGQRWGRGGRGRGGAGGGGRPGRSRY